MSSWSVYIILGSDLSLYTGITNDLENRLAMHSSGKGAKYFRGRSPLAVVHLETGYDRPGASRREPAIKKLSRAEKLELISSTENRLR